MTTAESLLFCACGEPLHYRSAESRRIVAMMVEQFGPTVTVETPWGTWNVPRHYIALHGINVNDVPDLVARYGWEKV